MTPEWIGRFRLDGVIGVGTFATVHRAFDERLEDVVVVKVLAENHSLNPDVRGRFIAEGRSLRRIRSAHVIEVYDIGENEHQQPYLVLEHADRGTLATRSAQLRAHGWSPSTVDVDVVSRSLAAAVEAVHRAGLVHRDLSPGNTLLCSIGEPAGTSSSPVVRSDERLVVADLGMCKDLAINSGLTVAGGTEGFRPPEQRGGPTTIDARADLWALSALVIWLLAGDRADRLDVRAALHRAGMPNRLASALLTSLATDPSERHADVRHWLADVQDAIAPALPVRISPATSRHRGVARPGRRTWPAVAGAAVLLVAAGVVGGVGTAWLDRSGERQRVEDVGAGQVRVVDTEGAASLSITGPAQVTVGDDARFVATASGVDHWVWMMPDGRVLVDEPALRVRASTTGRSELTLRARTADGDDLVARHEVLVVDE